MPACTAQIARSMGDPSGRRATPPARRSSNPGRPFRSGWDAVRRAVHSVRCRNGTVRCIDSRRALHPSGLPAKTPRMRAGTRRILTISGLVVFAVALAFVESVQDHLASAGFRGRDPFGFRLAHMLPPWLIVAALAPAIVAFVRRRPLAFEARALLSHGLAAALFAVAHMTLLAAIDSFRPGARPIATTIRVLLGFHFVFDLLLYLAIAGAVQALVENAVRHGIARRPGAGRIEIRAQRDGSKIRLEVCDDGPGLPAAAAEAGIGVRNTRERLLHRYGSEAALVLGTAPEGGTSAVVTLPWEAPA